MRYVEYKVGGMTMRLHMQLPGEVRERNKKKRPQSSSSGCFNVH